MSQRSSSGSKIMVINRKWAVANSAFALGALVLVLVLVAMGNVAAAERPLADIEPKHFDPKSRRRGILGKVISFFWQSGESSYEPVWPVSVWTSDFSFLPNFNRVYSHLVSYNIMYLCTFV